MNIKNWCKRSDARIGEHNLSYFEADSAKLSTAVAEVAAVLPDHYADPRRVAHILAKLGKLAAARHIADKLPTGLRGRSGDIGEILASNWVSEFAGNSFCVLKLRWKDHREMPMRGDDILAVWRDPRVEIQFLKGEVKSRARTQKKTIADARKALVASDGRPTPHSLSFVSDRLREAGEIEISDLIDKFQLTSQITVDQLSHLMFIFTGDNPCSLLELDLHAYTGAISQYAVGLRVIAHQSFIKQVYEAVTADGDQP